MYVFGQSVSFEGDLVVKNVAITQESVAAVHNYLRQRPLLTLTLWSFGNHFDTRRGIVPFWPVYDVNGKHELFIGHYSLWKCFMVQLYSGYWHLCKKHVLQDMLADYIVEGLTLKDMDQLVRVSGVDPVTTPKRRLQSGLFCLPANFMRIGFKLVATMDLYQLFSFCQCIEMEAKLHERFSISAWKMVFSNCQSKVSAEAIRQTLRESKTRYDELSFSFGVPCSDKQLELFHSVRRAWQPTGLLSSIPNCHFCNLYVLDTDLTTPVETLSQLKTVYAKGPHNDSHLRPHANRNFTRDNDRKVEVLYRIQCGLPPARKGRPRNSPLSRNTVAAVKAFRSHRKSKRRCTRKGGSLDITKVPLLNVPITPLNPILPTRLDTPGGLPAFDVICNQSLLFTPSLCQGETSDTPAKPTNDKLLYLSHLSSSLEAIH